MEWGGRRGRFGARTCRADWSLGTRTPQRKQTCISHFPAQPNLPPPTLLNFRALEAADFGGLTPDAASSLRFLLAIASVRQRAAAGDAVAAQAVSVLAGLAAPPGLAAASGAADLAARAAAALQAVGQREGFFFICLVQPWSGCEHHQPRHPHPSTPQPRWPPPTPFATCWSRRPMRLASPFPPPQMVSAGCGGPHFMPSPLVSITTACPTRHGLTISTAPAAWPTAPPCA